MKSLFRCALLPGIALLAGSIALAEQNIVLNGSMEAGLGAGGINEFTAEDWTFFGGGTVERSAEENLEPPGAGHSIKVYGGETTVGAYQDVPVLVGENVTISAWLYTRNTDHVGGDAEAKIKLEWVDSGGVAFGGTELIVLNAASAGNVWTPGSIGPIAAPSGAVSARFTCVWTWTTTSAGSAYWDDCSLSINGGANALLNSDIETPGTGGGNPLGIDHFTGFGGQAKSADQALHGSYSAMVQVGGTSGSTFSGLYQDTLDAEAGDHIFAQAWVYDPITGGMTDNSAAGIKLEFQPAGGGTLPPPEENLAFDEDDPADTWVLVSHVTTVPDDITLARIVLIADDTSVDNGPVYMDSSFAERSSSPGVNKLLNASFESGSSGANGLTNWTEFRGLNCTARKNALEVPAADGTSVLRIQGSCIAGVYQEIEVAPGETLTISALVRQKSTDLFGEAGSGARAGVKVEWKAGGIPPQIDIGGPDNTNFAGEAPGVWSPVFIDYVMPPGSAAQVRFTVIAGLYSASDVTVYFDAAECVLLNVFDGSDVDADSDEDMHDFAWLQRVFNGATPTVEFNSITFDQDEDGDVDINDWNFFRPRMTGPN